MAIDPHRHEPVNRRKTGAGPDQPAIARAVPSTTHRRVLLVDDHASVRDVYRQGLEKAGFRVVTGTSGEEALRILARESFDVIVSDITMAGIGGIELLERVRETDAFIPLVLFTGRPEIETAAKAVEYGATRYLTKPVRFDELTRVVEDAAKTHDHTRHERQLLQSAETRGVAENVRQLNHRFERAIKRASLRFQPIVDTRSQQLFAYEALVRTEQAGLKKPKKLLDAAERLGRIAQLGRRIDRLIAKSLESLDGKPLFVNVHPEELRDDQFYSRANPLWPFADQIVLELIERTPVDRIGQLSARLAKLRRHGFRLAIDDLGSGYSALTNFVHLRPEFAKIDQSLIRNIHSDRTKQRVVGSLMEACRELGIQVITEGVETLKELDAVIELGGTLVQGYVVGRPGRLGRFAKESLAKSETHRGH